MTKLIIITAITAVAALSTGCKSYDHGHGLSAGAGIAAGALTYEAAKYESDEKRMLYTGLAGLGTFALGELIRSGVIDSNEEHYARGYKQAEADTINRHYEVIQNIQEWKNKSGRHVKIYEFPGVDHRDGINYAPHTVKLRVEE